MLGIPNHEVRKALYKIVLPALTMQSNAQVITTQNMLLYSLKIGNLPEAMKCLKALIADVPYSNKKLASMDMEERYRLIEEAERAKLATMPPKMAEVYRMARFEELTADEMTERLQISKRTVEYHLYVSRKEMRQTIQKVIFHYRTSVDE